MIIASHRTRFASLATLCLTLSLASLSSGQDDPFRDDPVRRNPFRQEEPDKVIAPVIPLPPGEGGFIRKGDPVIESIMGSDPQSPAELLRVIDILLNVERGDLAIEFVNKLTELQLDDRQNYDLYKQAGSDAIFRIQFDSGLGAAGETLATSIIAGAERYATNAERIKTLVEEVITNEDRYQRSLALADLKVLGDAGAASLLEKLGDQNYENYWPRIRQAIRRFEGAAEGPLQAAWQSNSVKMQVEALHLLGGIQTSDAVETLMVPICSDTGTELQKKVAERSIRKLTGRVPDQAECESRLLRSARQYLMDQVVIDRDANDLLKWWRWDAGSRTLVPTWLTARTVARIRGFRRARDLLRINPARQEYQTLYWVTRLESAKLTAGLQKPLPATVLRSFLDTIQPGQALQVLDSALRLERIPAAIAACEVLGAMGQPQFLDSVNGQPGPLVRALEFGSMRLMSAACEAISRIDPNRAFAGSSTYLASLVYLSRSAGTPTALVGHVNLEQAQSIAALTDRSGYNASVATTSRELFEQARDDPDLQLIVVTDSLSQPGFSELVQALRSSSRTRQIPILLMVESENLDRARRLSERFENILASPMFVNELIMARQIDNLRQTLAYQDATVLERAGYAVMALASLERYASNRTRYPFFDLVNHEQKLLVSLGTPASAAKTCLLLGQLGTRDAQINLINTASNLQLPVSLRRIAAESFANAVKQHGVMLSREQILQQYERYNASENQPVETQQILGHLLDAIEKRL